MIFIENFFESDFRCYIKENNIKTHTAIEKSYVDYMQMWKNKKNKDLQDKTPVEYLNGLIEEGKIVKYIVNLFEEGVKPSDITVDLFTDRTSDQFVKILFDIFTQGNTLAKLFSVDCLENMEGDKITNFLLDVLINEKKFQKEVVDSVFNVLKYGRDNLESIIFDKTQELKLISDDEVLAMLLDILSDFSKKKLVLDKITEEFIKGEKCDFYANLIGRCGNEESITLLKEYLKENSPNKHMYLEIRNAIERLGGEVD